MFVPAAQLRFHVKHSRSRTFKQRSKLPVFLIPDKGEAFRALVLDQGNGA
jgi:hypothetical protein